MASLFLVTVEGKQVVTANIKEAATVAVKGIHPACNDPSPMDVMNRIATAARTARARERSKSVGVGKGVAQRRR